MRGVVITTVIVSAIFCSCSRNKPEDKTIVVGENVDSSAIAKDTATEMAIEHSYEYFKSLNVSENLVYDLAGYSDKNNKHLFAIMKRGADNKPDTLAKGEFYGDIKNAWVCDINHNGETELMFYSMLSVMQLSKHWGSFIGYEFGKNGEAKKIEWDNYNLLGDSMYLENDKVVNLRFETDGDKTREYKIYYGELKDGKLIKTGREEISKK